MKGEVKLKSVKAVYALIYNKDSNEVLMVYNKDSNGWSMPGGAVEENETLEEATIREVQEETGLLVRVGDVVAVNERFFQEKNEHAIFITFNAEIIGGEISIERPDEISKIKWVDIHTADKLMPYHKEGINKLKRNSARYCFQG